SGIGGRWVHLLLVIAILSVVADLLTRGGRGDLNPSDETAPEYSDDLFTALDNLRTYVIGEAVNTIDWYWKAKKSKARPSYVIRFLAWVLAAFGGLLPIIGGLLQSSNANPASQGILTKGLLASLLLGIAAALFGLDKTFGYSSGWARYVLTATNIKK